MRRELHQETAEAAGLGQPAMAWLAKEAAGLEELLGGPPFRVSILVALDPPALPPAAALERCLESCLAQAPAELEVLVGAGPERRRRCRRRSRRRSRRARPPAPGGLPATRPRWSRRRAATELLFADPGRLAAADLLYRYHQLVLREPGAERMLGCAGWPLDEKGEVKGPPNLASSARPHRPSSSPPASSKARSCCRQRAQAVTGQGGRPLDWALAVAAWRLRAFVGALAALRPSGGREEYRARCAAIWRSACTVAGGGGWPRPACFAGAQAERAGGDAVPRPAEAHPGGRQGSC